jgi:hypothetical protein
MDAAIHSVPHRATEPVRLVPSAQSLTVNAIYHLSETGRKASLLAGGDGRGLQRLSVQVPATRLHLVTVDVNGVARLKLQPRFELTEGQRVVRHDGPPTYDAPPSVEDLFRDAARNLELEHMHKTERMAAKERQRDADRDRRSQVARAFLDDPNQRAMPHPRPMPTRCYLATAGGRMLFDASADVGLARELPQEAFRRFRSDLQRRKERNLQRRAEQTALHAEKRRMIAEWAATRATDEQRARYEVGVLPVAEAVEALAEEAFDVLKDQPRYPLDGQTRLQTYLRAVTGRGDLIVGADEVEVMGSDAKCATAAQWAVVRQLKATLSDANVTLRAHQLSWRVDPAAPSLIVVGALVTRQVGPFILRREFAVPER